MSAYLVALLKINDLKEFDLYRAGVHETIDKHKGEVLVSDENAEVIEGEWPYTNLIFIEGKL